MSTAPCGARPAAPRRAVRRRRRRGGRPVRRPTAPVRHRRPLSPPQRWPATCPPAPDAGARSADRRSTPRCRPAARARPAGSVSGARPRRCTHRRARRSPPACRRPVRRGSWRRTRARRRRRPPPRAARARRRIRPSSRSRASAEPDASSSVWRSSASASASWPSTTGRRRTVPARHRSTIDNTAAGRPARIAPSRPMAASPAPSPAAWARSSVDPSSARCSSSVSSPAATAARRRFWSFVAFAHRASASQAVARGSAVTFGRAIAIRCRWRDAVVRSPSSSASSNASTRASSADSTRPARRN